MGGGADRWVWLAFLLVLALSGLIAYVGDLIGRRIGRKRLTIFGLRPKRTAILFTVLTGMLISGVAMALLLMVSEGARKRILTYNQTVNSLEEQIGQQRRLSLTAQQRADAAKREVEDAEQDLARRGQELQAATAAKRKAEEQLAGAKEQTTAAQRQAAATRQRVVAAQQRLAEAQRRLERARAQYARISTDLVAKQRALAAAETQLLRAEDVLDTVADLYAERQRQAEVRLQETETRLREAEQQLLEAKANSEEILADLKRFQQSYGEVIEGELIVRYREELGRSLFRFSTERPRLEQQFETFMRSIERDARERGAAPEVDGGDQAAMLPGDTAPARDIYRLNVLDYLAAATARESIWLRAIAIRNAAKGQPLRYQLRAVPDRLVFLAGDVLGTATLDGGEPEARLARQLEALIREQVNPLAQARNLLPNLDGDYSRVGPERWLPVLREIQEHGGKVEVDALAARDIRTGDALDVEFRVRDDAGAG